MTKQTNRKPGATAAVSAIAPGAYTRITNRIVADLEQGVRPWCKPWGGRPMATRVVGVDSACEIRLASTPFSSSAAGLPDATTARPRIARAKARSVGNRR